MGLLPQAECFIQITKWIYVPRVLVSPNAKESNHRVKRIRECNSNDLPLLFGCAISPQMLEDERERAEGRHAGATERCPSHRTPCRPDIVVIE